MENQNISDIIESYLKQILAESQQVEIRRAEIANQFNVVPSQINYVIKTRFTIQDGYVVQSKRGGGGYIRIEKVKLLDNLDFIDSLVAAVGDQISRHDSLSVVRSLFEAGAINRSEANIILAAINKDAINTGDRQVDEQIRAQILISILNHLRYES
ncbi:CtsR family transcriptional regulator [Levilactobacillus tujiorum]|uniref:Transcriptional regulator CtsR n=1 Tax=Levilactobacillus tujiorum TaxID=2912243 RepID=A0ABX1L1B2_9LACO|nr:CtsR family transcriptional regulator [Levilactobacillus tujiorum]MCH5463779.1 CtsR family transcriptional regulator [Levilactobacillus tujiorum]NLR10986.1 CtsR family transcriptional regulator [Lactobacillus sp. HBUAS51387]NLR28816.1 CtsR family transcriptional regulator [Levilactobacillus tujiorum]